MEEDSKSDADSSDMAPISSVQMASPLPPPTPVVPSITMRSPSLTMPEAANWSPMEVDSGLRHAQWPNAPTNLELHQIIALNLVAHGQSLFPSTIPLGQGLPIACRLGHPSVPGAGVIRNQETFVGTTNLDEGVMSGDTSCIQLWVHLASGYFIFTLFVIPMPPTPSCIPHLPIVLVVSPTHLSLYDTSILVVSTHHMP